MKNGTIFFENPPTIAGYASVVGEKESKGPLKGKFDKVCKGDMNGEKSFELAESKMQEDAANIAIKKASISKSDLDIAFAGDLLNQCIGSNYSVRNLNVPFAGLYGACSTMAESIIMSSILIDGGYANYALALTSSHFCASERQFRFPLEYGGQRPPTAQWTATGAGSVILSNKSGTIKVKAATIGKIVDAGITDINNMGGAMAPAAADTITEFLNESKLNVRDIDLILTGDLGEIGSALLTKLLEKEGISLEGRHSDCGMLLYDRETQDVHAGGSGCGCSASVLCSDILKRMEDKKLNKVIFIATGALMSPTSNQQGQSIPSIAHLVYMEV